MTPKIKGYLLTYLGWALGTTLAVIAAYGASGDVFQKFTDGEYSTNIFDTLIMGGFGSVMALVAALVVYQVVVLIASPLTTYLLLMHTHEKVVKTVALQFAILFASPIFIVLSVLTSSSVTLSVYLTLLWLMLTPFMSRYFAVRSSKTIK